MFLDERLPDSVIEKLARIEDATDWSFCSLVALSGLDPSSDFAFCDLSDMDFRGQDLRGFDFSGCDLRGCIIDDKTTIDETTILHDSQIDWLKIDDPTIVSAMHEVELASSSGARRSKLALLKSRYQSPEHIRRYLKALILKTNSVEAFFDYIDFFEPQTNDDISAVAVGLRKFSTASVKRSGSSFKYLSPSTISFKRLLDRVSEADNPIARDAFNRFLGKLNAIGRTNRNPSKQTSEADFQLLLAAIDEAGGQTSLNF